MAEFRKTIKATFDQGKEKQMGAICDDAFEPQVYEKVKGVPVAEEFYALFTGVALDLKGCGDKGQRRIQDFKEGVKKKPSSAELTLTVLDALEEMADEDDEEMPEFITEEAVELVRESLKREFAVDDDADSDEMLGNFTNTVRVMEAVDDEDMLRVASKANESLSDVLKGQGHVRRTRSVNSWVTLFEHDQYQGRSETFGGNGIVESLPDSWNHHVSSLKIPKGHSVVAFEEDDFIGKNKAFSRDTTQVSGMNDRIKSLIVIPGNINLFCYTVFEHTNFKGASKRFCGDQEHLPEDWLFKISSLKVEGKENSVIFYEGTFVGGFKGFTGDVAYVGDTWNDRVSSLQIRPWIIKDYEGYVEQKVTLYEHDDVKELMQDLQYYHEFMPNGGQVVIKGQAKPSQFAIKVNTQIGGEPFEFVMMPGRQRQIFIDFSGRSDTALSHTYDIKKFKGTYMSFHSSPT